MMVRFWGGWEFVQADASNTLPGETGYSKGLPMGSTLHQSPAGQVPYLPGRCAQGPVERQPGSNSNRQGLAG